MLATNTQNRGAVKLYVAPPIVGSKWNGKPQSHIDTQVGTYWEVMHKLSDSELQIQKALLNKVVDKRKVVAFNTVVNLKDFKHVEQSKAANEVAPRSAYELDSKELAEFFRSRV